MNSNFTLLYLIDERIMSTLLWSVAGNNSSRNFAETNCRSAMQSKPRPKQSCELAEFNQDTASSYLSQYSLRGDFHPFMFLHINLFLARHDVNFARITNFGLATEFEPEVENKEDRNVDVRRNESLVVKSAHEDGESTEDDDDDEKCECDIGEIRLEGGSVWQSTPVNTLCLQRPMELKICNTHRSPGEAVGNCGDTREPIENRRALIGDIEICQTQQSCCEQDTYIWYSSVR